MVKFELRQVGEAQQLIIKDGDNNTSLPIHRPLTGKHAHTPPVLDNIPSLQSSSWSYLQEGLPLLRSPLHTANTATDRSFSTLGRRIISGEVKWGDTLRVYGRFRHPLKYKEWVEEILDREGLPLRAAEIYDAVLASLFTYSQNSTMMRAFYEAWCTDTNSLHTIAGEISITPWDLHIIGGLPTFGSIYDETVPYPDELDNTFYDNTLLPPSCKFLFLAFHRLVGAEKKKSVSPTAWIKYWFKGGLQHKHPRPHPLAKSAHPTKVGNASSANGSLYDWLPETKRVFSDLDVPTALFDEVYLAAFLSCWLCIFVFPTGSTAYIRPTVFKPASLMASGKVLGLSFPVLAAIYKGLNTIALSPTPGLSSACFPQHYLITWMANYFGTHHRKKQLIAESKMSEFSGEDGAKSFNEEEARTEIHSGKWISWNAVSFAKRYTQSFGGARRPIDDEQRNRFVAMRPCLLSLRWKNAFNLEPYNPHRFCRQFGFSQRIPHESNKGNIHSSTLDEGMKHWLLSQHEYPDTTISIPCIPKSFKESVASNFSKWWEKVHGNYLIEGRKLLIKSIQGISPPPVEPKAVTPSANLKSTIETGDDSRKATKCSPVVGTKRSGKSLTTLKEVLGHHDVHAKKKSKTSCVSDLKDDVVEVLGDVVTPKSKEVELLLLDEDIETFGEGERVSFGSTYLVDYGDSSDHAEESNSKPLQEDDACSSTPSMEMSNTRVKSSSHPHSVSSASKYDEDICASSQKFVLELWETLIRILEEYPSGDLCLLEEKSVKITKLMEGAGSNDISHLKSMVSDFFAKAREYNDQSSLSIKFGVPDIILKEKSNQISVFVAKEEECKTTVAGLRQKIASITTKVDQLNAAKEKMQVLLAKEEDKIAKAQSDICSLELDLSKLKDQSSKSMEAVGQKKKLLRALEAQLGKLKTLKPFP